ncbi:hypothetical protein [uncultured Gimesia sp.]|uniref:hypothetical protein n=1 Tax=uncultured Gimesia sp. TaxID=1678688 RepID=UPI0030D756CE|tara:strand:- start:2988 stop:3251 length:264 start_codon:yes stop_codon:yes gene_type:complete
MSQSQHKDCFGTMFPDNLHLRNNQQNKGKVFSVWISQLEGAVLPVRSDRSIKTDIEQWDKCKECPEFDSCYKLNLAKVALESAITTQ